ncbi:MAG TPA: 16S rRNA (guanine(966)-N(2))-methyltransferase RsmD [Steroidobacteraceae bacterium]|nr:16S rRNA (guanine(966)-N(2))-methyltransferase RsmD [Steroidobacteraceae bacterium]
MVRTRNSRGAQARVIRIIGGTWRGRRFRFADVPDIRPTPDRVRETLFNWLGSRVIGARCLDLFAGSGALGLEALSRGAAAAVLVEQNAVAVRSLKELVATLGARGARVERDDALRFLGRAPTPFDIVFLDPPFAAGLLAQVAERLERNGWLAPDALIYVESSAREPLPALPASWQPLKAKRAGEVGYHLFARAARGTEPV